MHTFAAAADLILTFPTVLALCGGTLLGVAIGVLPGLGPAVGVSLVLPLTIGMAQIPAISMLLGIYGGSIYGGSVTAILINTPGTPSNAASCLDGYRMTMKGEFGQALGIAVAASVFGGIFSVIVLALFAPQLANWALKFGPAEMFALAIFALTCIAAVSQGSMAKGLIGGVLGLFLSVIGQDTFTGEARFTFGVFEFSAGLSLVPVLVGLFALSEVFDRLASAHAMDELKPAPARFRLPSLRQNRHLLPVYIKGSIIGTLLGILPGIGPTTASFVSYAEARRSSKHPERFGTGEPEGLAASESANNAVTGGALVPTLALGVPGDPITAILLGALVIKDIAPGPRLFLQHADLVTALFIALLLINLLLIPIAVGFSGRVAAALDAAGAAVDGDGGGAGDGRYLYAQQFHSRSCDHVHRGRDGLSAAPRRLSVAPIVIGFVLGDMVELNLRMGLIVYSHHVSQFVTRPIAASLLVLSVLILARPLFARLRRRRTAAAE